MASVGEEEVEYESDPEEAKRSLAMRRRVASDDEGEEEERENQSVDRRAVVQSDESDGQGGVAEYDYDDELDDEEEEEVYEEELEEVDEVVVVAAVKEIEGGNEDRGVAGDGEGEGEVVVAGELAEGEAGDEVEEEKKENEPFAVPTAGAFYMHDDRFRDNARGRNRRTFGGRKLWESKDERKWGHDKFEEMSMQERHYEEGRGNSKGRYRGRGRIRGADRGYTRGNRSKSFNENSNNNYESNNPNQTPKAVRGRGPRRYEPSARNSNPAPSTKSKQYGKPLEKSSHNSSGRVLTSASNADSDSIPAKGHVFASSLNYASPPFYPSSSSNKDNLNQKRDVQAGNNNRNPRQPAVDDNSPVTQPHTSLREKNVVGSVGMDKLHIDDSVNPAAGKSFNSTQMLHTGSSAVNGAQFPQARSQGRGMAFQGQMGYQPASHGQGSRVSPSTHAVHRAPMQGRGQPVQPSLQSPAHMLGQRPGSGSQASSPPKTAQSFNSFESGETESPSESSKSKNALVKGKTSSIQGNGRGSFLYSGAQVMGASGNMGVGHGDQNFPGTPAFLPVMQFGGQHPGGIGVPALGMAFPGYVARPQLGLGNSEMAWLPVLAGAAGALGASYGQPYIAVDGSYHARPSAQPTSSTGSSSKENNTNKPNNEWNSSQKQEIASDEFGQRQNKARRYSEMNFGQ